MKEKSRPSIMAKIFSLVILCSILTTSGLLYISSNYITKSSRSHQREKIDLHSKATSDLLNQVILSSIDRTNLILRESGQIKNKADAELYATALLNNQSRFFEFSMYKYDDSQFLKKEFSLYNSIFFNSKKIDQHHSYKESTSGHDDFIRNLKKDELQHEVLFSKQMEPRLLVARHNSKINKIYVLKFSLHNILDSWSNSQQISQTFLKQNATDLVQEKYIFNSKQLSSLALKLHAEPTAFIQKENLKIVPVNTPNLYLVTSILKTSLFPSSILFFSKSLILSLLLMTVFLILIYLLLKRITSIQEILKDAMINISSGNFDYRLASEKKSQYNSLYKVFNEMAQTVQKTIHQIIQSSNQSQNQVQQTSQTEKVVKAHSNKILSLINQSFFAFNEKGICLNIYNDLTLQMFGFSPEGNHLQALFPDFNSKELDLWLKSLFSFDLKFEDVSILGPRTSSLFKENGFSNIEVTYHPIYDSKQNIIVSIIGIATDKSEPGALTQNLFNASNKIASLQKILFEKEHFQNFVIKTHKELGRLITMNSQKSIEVDITKLEARALFKHIVLFSTYFSLEDYSKTNKSSLEIDNKINREDLDNLLKSTQKSILHLSTEYFDIFSDSQNRLQEINIKYNQLEDFYHYLNSCSSENQSLLENEFSQKILKVSLHEQLQFFVKTFEVFQTNMEPQFQFELTGEDFNIHRKHYWAFMSSLLTLFDFIHSTLQLETKDQTSTTERKVCIQHFLKRSEQRSYIEIIISNKALFINPLEVKRSLEKENANAFILSKEPEEIIQHIFDPLLSNVQKVALFTVRRKTYEIDGKFKISSTKKDGTHFSFKLPYR